MLEVEIMQEYLQRRNARAIPEAPEDSSLQLWTPLFTLTLTTSLTREWTTLAQMTHLAFSLHWLSEYI
jgi:hypothetical protein